MITVFVPEGCAGQIVGADSKTTFNPYSANGWTLIDVPRETWVSLMRGPQGLLWSNLNPEIPPYLAANPDFLMGRVFPGEARIAAPPPPPPAATKSGPVSVKMRAPEGTTSISYAGKEVKIAKDGTITVPDHVAADLHAHGFRPA
jgi:hypothetical protein